MTTKDIYLRLSDLRDDDLNDAGNSKGLVEHERTLREFVARLGWDVGRVIVENDIDAASGKPKSASAFKRRTVTLADGSKVLRVIRPGFRALLDRITAHDSTGFVAIDLDRVVRDPRDLEDLIDTTRATKANIRSLTGSLQFTNGGTDAEITMARVMVAMGNKASSDTGRRVSAARLREALAGEFGGGRRPYGFANDGITPIDAEVGVISDAARDVLAGVPLRSIARGLNARHVPATRADEWSAESLRDILLRPRNIAKMVHQGAIVADAPWPAILTPDVYAALCSKLTDPSRDTNPTGRAPRWLGSGIYRCVCGATMEVQAGATRPTRYRCSRKDGRGGTHVRRDAVALDNWVTTVVIKMLSRPDALDLLDNPAAGIDTEALRTERAALRERLSEWDTDRTAGRVTRDRWLAQVTSINNRLAEIDRSLANTATASPLAPLVGAADVAGVWHSLSLGVQREIIKVLITVTVLPTDRGRGFDTSTIKIEPRQDR